MLGYVKKFIHGTRTPERGFMFGTQLLRMVPVLERLEFEKICSNLTDTG